ncbi:MAG: type VI secretion protein ImpB [Hyphomicrobium sp.]|nr:MAG: type VI secretion protein ImpB [Hyphomicrobium sp.]
MRHADDFASLYIDFDSFFARAEQHMRPNLRGRPVGVIPLRTPHTSLIAASPEAKRFGVKTGTPVGEALERCPDIKFVIARHDVYVRLHHEIIAVVDDVVPVHKICSIDEVSCRLLANERAAAAQLARTIKRELARRIGPTLTCSIGLAPNELLAKIAAEMDKPDGLVALRQADLPGRLLDLELTDIPGIGQANAARLQRCGITNVRALWALSSPHVRAIWGGVAGDRFWAFLHGYQIEHQDTQRGMFGHSRVLGPDWRTPAKTYQCARLLLVKAMRRMRREQYAATALSLSLRRDTGSRWEAEFRGPAFRDDHTALQRLGTLFTRARQERGIGQTKKVHVMLAGIVPIQNIQRDLLEDANARAERERWERLSDMTDALHHRYKAPVLTLGHHGTSPGDYAGAKIAFGRIPALADF